MFLILTYLTLGLFCFAYGLREILKESGDITILDILLLTLAGAIWPIIGGMFIREKYKIYPKFLDKVIWKRG